MKLPRVTLGGHNSKATFRLACYYATLLRANAVAHHAPVAAAAVRAGGDAVCKPAADRGHALQAEQLRPGAPAGGPNCRQRCSAHPAASARLPWGLGICLTTGRQRPCQQRGLAVCSLVLHVFILVFIFSLIAVKTHSAVRLLYFIEETPLNALFARSTTGRSQSARRSRASRCASTLARPTYGCRARPAAAPAA